MGEGPQCRRTVGEHRCSRGDRGSGQCSCARICRAGRVPGDTRRGIDLDLVRPRRRRQSAPSSQLRARSRIGRSGREHRPKGMIRRCAGGDRVTRRDRRRWSRAMSDMRTIVVGYDGEEPAARALDRAIDEAQRSDSRLVVVAVSESTFNPEGPQAPVPSTNLRPHYLPLEPPHKVAPFIAAAQGTWRPPVRATTSARPPKRRPHGRRGTPRSRRHRGRAPLPPPPSPPDCSERTLQPRSSARQAVTSSSSSSCRRQK